MSGFRVAVESREQLRCEAIRRIRLLSMQSSYDSAVNSCAYYNNYVKSGMSQVRIR